MTSNPRDKYDILWELVQASISFGRETEKLFTGALTIEKQSKAFRRFRKAYAKAVLSLETIETGEPLANLIRRGAEDGYYRKETPSNYLDVLAKIRKGERD